MYRVVIEEINDEGNRVIHDEMHSSIAALMESADGTGFNEVLMHTNMMEMANLIVQSKRFRGAAEMATAFAKYIDREKAEDKEDNLINKLMEGLQ